MVRYYIIKKINRATPDRKYMAYTPSGTAMTIKGYGHVYGPTPSSIRRNPVIADPTKYVELTKPDPRGTTISKDPWAKYSMLPTGFGAKNLSISSNITPTLARILESAPGGRTRRAYTRDVTLKEVNNRWLREHGIRPNPLIRSMLYQSEISDELQRLQGNEGLGSRTRTQLTHMNIGRRLRKSGKARGEARLEVAALGVPLRGRVPRLAVV